MSRPGRTHHGRRRRLVAGLHGRSVAARHDQARTSSCSGSAVSGPGPRRACVRHRPASSGSGPSSMSTPSAPADGGGGGDLGDRGLERLGVAGRRRAVAADLADVLAGGGLQFAGRRGLVGPTEGLDASAHGRRVHGDSRRTLPRDATPPRDDAGSRAPSLVGRRGRGRAAPRRWRSTSPGPGVPAAGSRGTACPRRTWRPANGSTSAPRSLYLDCRGSGSPTVILEAGSGQRQRHVGRGPRRAGDDDPDVRLRPGRARAERPATAATPSPTRPPISGRSSRPRASPARSSWSATRSAAPTAASSRRRIGARSPGSCWSTRSIRTSRATGSTRCSGRSAASTRRGWTACARTSRASTRSTGRRARPSFGRSSLAGLPIEVLVAPRGEPRLDEATNAAIAEAWRAAFESLSPGHVVHTVAWGAGHEIQIDRPDLVIESVRRLLALGR